MERAYALLLSGKVARAFDLSREDPGLRDRYGRHMYGQSLLLARRLVEAGRADRSGQHGARPDLGHALGQLQVAQGPAAAADRPGRGGPARRPASPGTAGRDPGRRDRRVWPHAPDRLEHRQQQYPRRPRSLGGRLLGRLRRRRRARGPDDRSVGQDGRVSGQPPLHAGRPGRNDLSRARHRPGHRAARPARPPDPALHAARRSRRFSTASHDRLDRARRIARQERSTCPSSNECELNWPRR